MVDNGNSIRRWRKHAGLSIKEAAARSGLNVATLSMVETNKQAYTQVHLERLAVLYGCRPSQLLEEPNSSYPVTPKVGETAPNQAETAFNLALCSRVKASRERRGWTAAQMATALGITDERYRKYESFAPLPAFLMERFALIADTTVDRLLSSKAGP